MKTISFPVKLSLLAVALLLMGVVGFKSYSYTSAALQYSQQYNGELNTEHLYVQLNENGTATETLLQQLKQTDIVPETSYQEVINVTNSSSTEGGVDEYVRVTLHKYWLDANGNKDTTLDPALIQLHETGNWILDETRSTSEQRVYYYAKPLAPGESSTALVDSFMLDSGMLESSDVKEGNVVTTVFTYDGCSFGIDARVDAVQTHNAQKAIASAWGRSVSIADDGTLSLS